MNHETITTQAKQKVEVSKSALNVRVVGKGLANLKRQQQLYKKKFGTKPTGGELANLLLAGATIDQIVKQ